jgi:cell division protein FtsQ
VAQERKKPRRRRKKRRNPIFAIISFFFICGALLLGISVFFKISVIKVAGGTRYSPEQVIAASGIKAGDNLFFINKFDATSKVFKQLPYVEKVTIKKDLPNTIILNVTDAAPAAYIQSGDGYWLMDKSLKLLENTSAENIANLISVLGVTLNKPEAGKTAELSDSVKQSAFTQLMSELVSRDMLKSVTKIDITSSGDIKFFYLNRFTVKLGSGEDIKTKLDLLKTALDSNKINALATGSIDLSQKTEAHFISD